jgi:hypothetical protein
MANFNWNNTSSAMATTKQPAGAGQWNNAFQPFYNQAGNYAQKFLNMNLSANPLASGGVLSDPSKFRASWGGGQQVNPNDPNIGGFLNNLSGGQYRAAQQAASKVANAGVAAGRGGYGVAGGISPASTYAQNAIQSAANNYGQNYSQAVNWQMQNADRQSRYDLSGMNSWADLYGKIYGTNAQTGTTLSGQQLQAAQSADESARANQQLQYNYWANEANKRAQEIQNEQQQWQNTQTQLNYPEQIQAQRRQQAAGESAASNQQAWNQMVAGSRMAQDVATPKGGYSFWPGSLYSRLQDMYGSAGGVPLYNTQSRGTGGRNARQGRVSVGAGDRIYG